MHADLEHARLLRHPLRNQAGLARYWMRKAFVDDPAAVKDGLLRSLGGADAVVSHPTMASVVEPVATHLGIPLVAGNLFPMMIPTQQWAPPVGARSPNLGPRINRPRGSRPGRHAARAAGLLIAGTARSGRGAAGSGGRGRAPPIQSDPRLCETTNGA